MPEGIGCHKFYADLQEELWFKAILIELFYIYLDPTEKEGDKAYQVRLIKQCSDAAFYRPRHLSLWFVSRLYTPMQWVSSST
jgi:hypothetical protein